MVILKKHYLVLLLAILAVLTLFLYIKLLLPPFLVFSDAAKFGDIAKQIIAGRGYTSSFSFFDARVINSYTGGNFVAAYPPVFPLVISIFFKLFGSTDGVVVLSSGIFYVLSGILVYLIGKNIFGKETGFLAAICYLFDPAILDYATSGASESLFIFEILLATFLFLLNRKGVVLLGVLSLIALYLTKSSAVIYIIPILLLYVMLTKTGVKPVIKLFFSVVVGLLGMHVISSHIPINPYFYSPLAQFFEGVSDFSSQAASTSALRGGDAIFLLSIKSLLSKLFYNLYNFYKLLPQIFSPYLIGFYFLSYLVIESDKRAKLFRLTVLIMIIFTFISAAATLPNFRYLHPVAPFIYLISVDVMVRIAKYFLKDNRKVFIASLFLVFVFVGGQIFGKLFLDSRFNNSRVNPDKPSVYMALSRILKEKTFSDQLVVTNLDTWGSWYGDRRTVWLPLNPSQLISQIGEKTKIDAIFLTSYKINDENYALGEGWYKIFTNPLRIEEKFISDNFMLSGMFTVEPKDTYEREGAAAVLLIRK